MKLTKRESEVLQLISNEFTTKEIAEKLGVSISTIESHRRNLLRKTNSQSVVGLVKEAVKQGWINED